MNNSQLCVLLSIGPCIEETSPFSPNLDFYLCNRCPEANKKHRGMGQC